MRVPKAGLLGGVLATAMSLGGVWAQSARPAPLDAAYRERFETWRAELVEDRRENWLTLVGLFWLKSGENSFGTDPGNALVFPAGSTTPRSGSLRLEGRDVHATFLPGSNAMIEGKTVTNAQLAPDISGHPTVVKLGSLRFYVIQRGERVGVRVKDLTSDAAKQYRGAIFYPLDPAFRIEAAWVPGDGSRTVDVPNVLGDVTHTKVVGEARFRVNGQEIHLSALGGDPAEQLSFIFSDATRKTETYPAGRFLESGPVKDGKVTLDFNYAYNPPCSVTPYATCPLPPKEDQLTVAIPAGEKYTERRH
ncbi:MAG TPA: DUF1684 domain-containing protein [Terriglobales bacterium]|nr:DUF1684 domain-containing protein [Terriglobales bacterium]